MADVHRAAGELGLHGDEAWAYANAGRNVFRGKSNGQPRHEPRHARPPQPATPASPLRGFVELDYGPAAPKPQRDMPCAVGAQTTNAPTTFARATVSGHDAPEKPRGYFEAKVQPAPQAEDVVY